MEWLKKIKTGPVIWITEHIKFMVCCILAGGLIYSPMAVCGLVNDLDGIWHTSNFVAGNWEISLGRGGLRYLDKLRFGVVSTSLNAILYLCILAITLAIIIVFFSIENPFQIFLLAAAVVTSPVVCATLSYCYTSFGYGMAFLFSVLAAYCMVYVRMGKGYFSLAGSGCLAMAMACYQAYFGVTCLLLLLILCKKVVQKAKPDEIKRLFLSAFFSICCGGVFYFIIVQALLLRSGMDRSSYRGANSINVFNICNSFSVSAASCYRQFFDYFWMAKMFDPLSGVKFLMIGIWVCAIGLILCQIARLRDSKRYAVLFLGCMLCIPLACNVILVVAPGNSVTILMSMGMVLGVVLLPTVFTDQGKGLQWLKKGYFLLTVLLCWFNLFSVTNDQLALQEGKTAVIALAENVTHKLLAEGYLDDGYDIVLIGRPAENPAFYQSMAYNTANPYARFGQWSVEADNYRRSWMGVLANYCGMNLNLCSSERYDFIRQADFVKEMSVFPLEGSIRVVDDSVVVKISDLY